MGEYTICINELRGMDAPVSRPNYWSLIKVRLPIGLPESSVTDNRESDADADAI